MSAQASGTLYVALGAVLLAAPAAAGGSGAAPRQDPEQPGAPVQEAPRPRGSISGRLTFDDGAPASTAVVTLRGVGETALANRAQLPADDGAFVFDGLGSGLYRLEAAAPGYVQAESGERAFYRPGDTATISLARGGVITGTVTDLDGEPVAAISVRADAVGGASSARSPVFGQAHSDKTDDRGVYRIFGLPAGSYVVSAGGGGASFGFLGDAYSGYARTYYPSAARAGAARLNLGPGQELTGVDVRFRREQGHRVAGSVSGAFSSSGGMSSAVVTLTRVPDGSVEDMAFVVENAKPTFSFDGVPDGEYQATAASGFGLGESSHSEPRRVVVRGADVSGVALVLAPLGSISGRVAVEAPGDPRPEGCPKASEPSLDDMAVSAVRDAGGAAAETELILAALEDVPNRKGGFGIRNVRAGLYRLELSFRDEDLYLKSIAVEGKPDADGKPAPPVDAAATGLKVAPGLKLSGVAVTLGRGAASLKGRFETAPNAPAPPRMLAILVPAEPGTDDEVTRFYETVAERGAFELKNVAPGAYWVVGREAPQAEASPGPHRRLAWDRAERLKLRAAGKASGAPRELKVCQRLSDVVVRVPRGAK